MIFSILNVNLYDFEDSTLYIYIKSWIKVFMGIFFASEFLEMRFFWACFWSRVDRWLETGSYGLYFSCNPCSKFSWSSQNKCLQAPFLRRKEGSFFLKDYRISITFSLLGWVVLCWDYGLNRCNHRLKALREQCLLAQVCLRILK